MSSCDNDVRLADYLAQSASFRMGLQLHFVPTCSHALLDRPGPCELIFLAKREGSGVHEYLVLVHVVHRLDRDKIPLQLKRLSRAHTRVAGMTSLPIHRAIACNHTSDGCLPFPVCRIGPEGSSEVHVIAVDEFCEDGTWFDKVAASRFAQRKPT
jgi:hypothetical protein